MSGMSTDPRFGKLGIPVYWLRKFLTLAKVCIYEYNRLSLWPPNPFPSHVKQQTMLF